jgi:hypothetical protein
MTGLLPTLQLGGFAVAPRAGNPAVQIVVLLELCGGMLQRIEAALGIAPGSVSVGYTAAAKVGGCGDYSSGTGGGIGSSSTNSGGGGGRMAGSGGNRDRVLTMDAMSVSVRETLLSQEMFRVAAEEGSGVGSLRKIMDDVKNLLDGRW